MAITRKQTETVTTYPANPDGWPEGVDGAAIWQRIEAYTAYRWTPRQVVWIVEGEGEWVISLTPATILSVEKWESGAWVQTDPPASPMGGYDFPGDGPYRVTATVGAGPVPAAVNEAANRLALYSMEIGADGMTGGHTAHTSHSVDIGGNIKEDFDRPANWAAKALINSGAADLLRPYRRA